MTTTDVLQAALALPHDERTHIVQALLESLDGLEDTDAESIWAKEATRRVEEIGQGDADLIDGDEAHRRIHSQLESMRR